MTHPIQRRDFLRQSFAFSALAAGLGARGVLAQAPNPGAKHILMVGDWGKDGDHSAQTEVAAAMARYAHDHSLKTEALFMLGDSWYGPLLGGENSPRWQTQFEEMYPRRVFDCPAYSIMGNHDYQRMPFSKVEAELLYARKPGTRWTQPALWYSFDFPKENPLMRVIALDSNMPNGRMSFGVDFTLTDAQRQQQLAWFRSELSRSTSAPFTVVLGHHPVFSNGPHGDHPILKQDWEPLLRQHKVHLYLAGHDHDLQHLEFAGHPTSFVSSGAGGADLYTLKIGEKERGPYAEKVYGFSHLEVTPEKLTLRHVDAQGRIVHGFSKLVDGVVTLGA
ncbi:Calcineurin-like phosphoesterase [Granulicella rosea]|uniref:Calcineurin-like phosphoesterase n=1 Tax=Granulicella rosea TaxID=474952 RepID=A0A239EI93_9BACT|nr:metallophosphoesterase [Granulicella rosea]SNS44347.1 Calcineurin-like phosphoesterase [Granulicella rosea]